MTSLIDRLRMFGAYIMDDDGNVGEFSPNALTSEAADEIERLRAAGDALATAVRAGRWDDALDSWEEARRG